MFIAHKLLGSAPLSIHFLMTWATQHLCTPVMWSFWILRSKRFVRMHHCLLEPKGNHGRSNLIKCPSYPNSLFYCFSASPHPITRKEKSLEHTRSIPSFVFLSHSACRPDLILLPIYLTSLYSYMHNVRLAQVCGQEGIRSLGEIKSALSEHLRNLTPNRGELSSRHHLKISLYNSFFVVTGFLPVMLSRQRHFPNPTQTGQ